MNQHNKLTGPFKRFVDYKSIEQFKKEKNKLKNIKQKIADLQVLNTSDKIKGLLEIFVRNIALVDNDLLIDLIETEISDLIQSHKEVYYTERLNKFKVWVKDNNEYYQYDKYFWSEIPDGKLFKWVNNDC